MRLIVLLVLLLPFSICRGQKEPKKFTSAYLGAGSQELIQEINAINTPDVALAPLRYLASDELMGRGTLRPEINIAARYISEQLRSLGVKEVAGTKDFFQNFEVKIRF